MANREDQIVAAVRWLVDDRVANISISERQSFLQRKGLTDSELDEAIRRSGGSSQTSAPSVLKVSPTSGGPSAASYGPGAAPYSSPYQASAMSPFATAPMPPAWTPAANSASSTSRWLTILGGFGIGSAIATVLSALIGPSRRQRSAPHQSSHAASASVVTSSSQAQELTIGKNGVRQPRSCASCKAEAAEVARLEELAAMFRTHMQDSRDLIVGLQRTADQQHRQFQTAVTDFGRKVEESSRKKPGATQRVEISPESLEMLKSLLTPNKSAVTGVPAAIDVSAGIDAAIRRLLHSADSKAQAKKLLQTVSLIVHNLVAHPTQDKFREVNGSSASLQENAAAKELLKTAGFALTNSNFVFPADHKLDMAEKVRDLLQVALRDSDKRWEQVHASETTVVAVVDGTSSATASSSTAHGGNAGATSSNGVEADASSVADSSVAPVVASKPAAAPWFSSVVQKQLQRIPTSTPGGSTASTSVNSNHGHRNEDDAHTGSMSSGAASSSAGGHNVSEIAAHPAEARPGAQEPEIGG